MKRNIYYLIICLLTLTAVKGQNNEPGKILNTAIYQEEVNGDLQKAIGLYQKIVTSFPENRSIAATAQLHIGICYEKLGKKQASEAYNKVIKQFADQIKTAEIAKSRLLSLKNQSPTQNLTTFHKSTSTQIPLEKNVFWNNDWMSGPFDFSPNGKKFVYMARTENPGENTRLGNVLFTADFSGYSGQLSD